MIAKGKVFQTQYIVSEKVYNGFRYTFEDHNPLHTDETFAKSKGFKGCVTYGNILNGFLSHFIGEVLPMKNIIIHAQKIKFSKPVFIDDELILTAEVAEVYESVNVFVFKFTFLNTDKKSVAKGQIQIGVI